MKAQVRLGYDDGTSYVSVLIASGTTNDKEFCIDMSDILYYYSIFVDQYQSHPKFIILLDEAAEKFDEELAEGGFTVPSYPNLDEVDDEKFDYYNCDGTCASA